MTARTWGPFTGRQLMVMFIALMVGVVMIPSAVWAVDSFTNVAVQDPVTGYKARLTSSGRLLVGDGNGPLSVDGTVKLDPTANQVKVQATPAEPVNTREAPTVFGDSAIVTAEAGLSACTPLELAAGRIVRLESVTVSIQGAAGPGVYLSHWTENVPNNGLLIEQAVPVSAASGAFFPWSGFLDLDTIVRGGSEFDADGLPARSSLCVKAPSGNASSARFVVTGVYVDA